MEGWWDSPDAKADDVSREQADGTYDLPVYYEARYVTITGIFIADNEAKMFDGMNRFSAIMRGPSRLQVVGYGKDQWVDVVRASRNVITPATDKVCHWQLRAKATDSRKFGEFESFAISAGPGVGVHHRGNYEATPLIRVHGPTVAYTVTGPEGEQYTVTGGLGAGNEHVIDFNDGLLRVNGAITAAAVTKAELWLVPPGQKVTATLSTGNGHIELLDTYI